jgi:hypothetical protein
VDWWDNSAAFLIRFSAVNSDAKVNQNSALAQIDDNTIGGNLQCQANQPPPKGARNVVDGNEEDRCERFDALRDHGRDSRLVDTGRLSVGRLAGEVRSRCRRRPAS